MMNSLHSRSLPALLLCAASSLFALPALAEPIVIDDTECSVDADCENGLSCEIVSEYVQGCPPAPACADDDEDCDDTHDCNPNHTQVMGCVPPPPAQCDPTQSASTCASGLICLTYTYEQCSVSSMPVCDTDDPSCDPNAEPVDPPECLTESESYCVPPYFGSCAQDSDCGAGFSCVDEPEFCTTLCTDTEPPTCTESCEPSSQEKYCELQEVSCASDADCAGELTCETFEEPVPLCAQMPPEDGSECNEDSPSNTYSYCVPPNWDYWGDNQGGRVEYDEQVLGSSGRGDNEQGEWTVIDKQAAQAPSSGDANAEADAGGCQVAHPAGSLPASGLGLLAALGMMFGLRRRKKA